VCAAAAASQNVDGLSPCCRCCCPGVGPAPDMLSHHHQVCTAKECPRHCAHRPRHGYRVWPRAGPCCSDQAHDISRCRNMQLRLGGTEGGWVTCTPHHHQPPTVVHSTWLNATSGEASNKQQLIAEGGAMAAPSPRAGCWSGGQPRRRGGVSWRVRRPGLFHRACMDCSSCS
jgi:hypothetical protein